MTKHVDAHQLQLDIFRKMTPGERVMLACQLHYEARALKRAGLKMQHPGWTDEQIERKVREIFFYGTG